MRTILRSPIHRLVSRRLVLLSYTGRRSGRTFSIPVGMHDIDEQMCVLTNSRWRVNLRGAHDLELLLAGQRHAGRGILDEDPDSVAAVYARLIEQLGRARAGRALGIRINVDRTPTLEELRDAVKAWGLSILRITLSDDRARSAG